MDKRQFDELAGRDDALYRTLGLLIRHLHATRVIEAPDLLQEIRLLASQLDTSQPTLKHTAAGMESIAATLQAEQPDWQEARTVADLFRAGQQAKGKG